MISFVKYEGTGNDFILIDDRGNSFQEDTRFIARLCDRHFGIGADGLILIRSKEGVDFEMVYYNSDGRRSSMCGNGGRCAAAFAFSLGIAGDQMLFEAFDGLHHARIVRKDPFVVSLSMSDVSSVENNGGFLLLDTGSPHYVCFVSNVNHTDVFSEGRRIRNMERFRDAGINVNFAEVKGDTLSVRTYERGVENETLSCGTGVTAAVIAAYESGRIKSSPGHVDTPGGQLKVYFTKADGEYSGIWLEGPASAVFSGTFMQ